MKLNWPRWLQPRSPPVTQVAEEGLSDLVLLLVVLVMCILAPLIRLFFALRREVWRVLASALQKGGWRGRLGQNHKGPPTAV
jgi:hypothetical protein